MFATLIGWLVATLVGLVITGLALKNPKLQPEQRKHAKLFAVGIMVMLGILAALSYRNFSWSSIYSEPLVTSTDGFYSVQNNWLIISGKVGDDLTLSGRDDGYAVFAEYSGSGDTRKLRDFRGEKDLKVILSDGTRISFSEFDSPSHTWNWPEQSNFRFLKPGDSVVVEAMFSETTNSEGEKGYSARDVEYVYYGSAENFKGSWLFKQGKYGGYLHLVAAILCPLSIMLLLGLLIKNGGTPKVPEPKSEEDDSAE